MIDSPELAQIVRGLARDALAGGAYKLRLSADSLRIQWVEADADGHEVVHTDEPTTTPGCACSSGVAVRVGRLAVAAVQT